MLEVPRGAEQPTYRLVLSPAQLLNVLETQLQRSESGSRLHLIFTRNSPLYGFMYTECPAMQLLSNQGRIFFCSVKKFPMSCSHPREQSAGRTSNNATCLNPNFSYLIQRDFSLAFFPVQSQPNIYIFYLSSMLQSSHFVNFLEIFY